VLAGAHRESRSFSTGEQARERFAGAPVAEVLAAFGLVTPPR